jgi:hypothetical protein
MIKQTWKLTSSLYTLYIEGDLNEHNIYTRTDAQLFFTADVGNHCAANQQFDTGLEELVSYALLEGPAIAVGDSLQPLALYMEDDSSEASWTWAKYMPHGAELLDSVQFTVTEATEQ